MPWPVGWGTRTRWSISGRSMGELEIVHGVVMGNRSLETGGHNYPRDLFHYCVGLDSLVLRRGATSRRTCPTRWRST